MNINDILDKDIGIFNLILNSSNEIRKQWEYISLNKGQIICEYGESCDYFYIIVSGYANIYHTSEKGKTYSQSIYIKGDYIGELEIFTNKPFICGVEAMTDIDLIRMEKSLFLDWVKNDLQVLYYLMNTLCKNTYKLSKKASDDTLYSLKFRICDYLIQCKENEDYYRNYKIFLSKEHLSEKFVVTKRSINRILKEFSDKELIDIESSYIKIKDLNGVISERESERYL